MTLITHIKSKSITVLASDKMVLYNYKDYPTIYDENATKIHAYSDACIGEFGTVQKNEITPFINKLNTESTYFSIMSQYFSYSIPDYSLIVTNFEKHRIFTKQKVEAIRLEKDDFFFNPPTFNGVFDDDYYTKFRNLFKRTFKNVYGSDFNPELVNDDSKLIELLKRFGS